MFSERVYDSRYLLELSERNPEAALAWVQLVRELGGGRFVEDFARERIHPRLYERAFNPNYLLKLSEHNPVTALFWLQCVLDLGGMKFLEEHAQKFYDRTFNNTAFECLARLNPYSFATALRLARAMNIPQVTDRIIRFVNYKPHQPNIDSLPISAINDLNWIAKLSGNTEFFSGLGVETENSGTDHILSITNEIIHRTNR